MPMRTDTKSLSSETQFAIRRLQNALALEPNVHAAQVTFDHGVEPTIDIIWEND